MAPLAASMTPVDFVTIGFGLAYGPLSEDSDQVMQDLAAKGWGPKVQQEAREITDVTGAFVASKAAVGFSDLDAVRTKYRSKPWYADIKGEFTGLLLRTPNAQIMAMTDQLENAPPWTYDPLPVLSRLQTPMLWIQAQDDTGAPPEATRRRLIDLSAQDRPITLLEFPHTDHGIVQYEVAADGRRVLLSNAPGYFKAVLDWARDGHLKGSYGDGRVFAQPR